MEKMQQQRNAARVAEGKQEQKRRQQQQQQQQQQLQHQHDEAVTGNPKNMTSVAPTRKVTRSTKAAHINSSTKAPNDDLVTDELDSTKKLPRRQKGKRTAGLGITEYFQRSNSVVDANPGTGSVAAALEQAANEQAANPMALGAQQLRSARQPDLVSGGIMRSYQLEGLEWLKSLYENGLNGILADEMGLGKTIQTISFLAFLRSKHTYGPFLVAAPLSTLNNWVDEFARWTPDIPVVLYHGTKPEREEIRRTKLVGPGRPNFPVVCTSYEICMNDRKFLASYHWKFIVIVGVLLGSDMEDWSNTLGVGGFG